MEMTAPELERMMFFESARQQAEQDYSADKKDTSALTRWGGALLELANFRQPDEASRMIDEAVEKFKQALNIEPNKHDTLWCLGNAYTSQGFLTSSEETARGLFDQAKGCFQQAVDLDPRNEVYRKGLEMTARAPELYAEIHRQISAHEHERRDTAATPKAKQTVSDFWYDLAGYGILVVAAVSIAYLARGIATSTPSLPAARQ